MLIELRKLTQKEHPLKILAVLQSIIKRWLRIKVEANENKTAQDISRIINLHEFVVKQDMEKLKKIPLVHLINLRKALTEIEFSIKSGKMSDDVAFDMIFAAGGKHV
jgi:DNA polymerase III delta subunit